MGYAIQTLERPKQEYNREYVALPSNAQLKEDLLQPSDLERQIKESETIIAEQDCVKKIHMSDCPCPCPPIVTAALYVTFSPIF